MVAVHSESKPQVGVPEPLLDVGVPQPLLGADDPKRAEDSKENNPPQEPNTEPENNTTSSNTSRRTQAGKEFKALCDSTRGKLQRMADKGDPKPLADWKAAKDKRSWIQQFQFDPSCSWITAQKTDTMMTKDTDSTEIIWLTEDQLVGPNWLNNALHAKTVCENELNTPPRPPGRTSWPV